MNFKARIRFVFTGFGLFLYLFVLPQVSTPGADTTSDTVNTESRSYQLYSEKNWNKLIQFDREAISRGQDYFYIRLRTGIGLFEQKKYRAALTQLRVALEFNARDETALEYLYYCYLYSGRFEEARKLNWKKLPAVSAITFEYGNKSSDSSRLFHNANYINAGLEQYINNRFSLFHAFTWFGQTELVGAKIQLQYYIRANIPLKNNFLFSPAFQYVFSSFVPVPPPDGIPMNPPGTPPPPSNPPPINQNYFIFSFLLTKHMPWLDIGIGSTAVFADSSSGGAKNTSTQYINDLKIVLYPLQNNRIAVGCDGIIHSANAYQSVSNAFSPFLSVWPHTKINVLVNYFRNQGMNTIENNGYLVNNSNDFTRTRWTAICSYTLNRHLAIYALYELENNIEEYQGFRYNYTLMGAGIRIMP